MPSLIYVWVFICRIMQESPKRIILIISFYRNCFRVKWFTNNGKCDAMTLLLMFFCCYYYHCHNLISHSIPLLYSAPILPLRFFNFNPLIVVDMRFFFLSNFTLTLLLLPLFVCLFVCLLTFFYHPFVFLLLPIPFALQPKPFHLWQYCKCACVYMGSLLFHMF